MLTYSLLDILSVNDEPPNLAAQSAACKIHLEWGLVSNARIVFMTVPFYEMGSMGLITPSSGMELIKFC